MNAHSLRSSFDREVAAVNDDLLRMQKLVDRSIVRSLDCLKRRDHALAQQVIDEDVQINELRFKIEEACLALIATQQPAAGDLRSIVAAMNIVVDMERMADHATGIAKPSYAWAMNHCSSRSLISPGWSNWRERCCATV